MSNRIGKCGQFAQNHRRRIASPAKRSELDAPRMPPDFIGDDEDDPGLRNQLPCWNGAE
jgi:hypothetical protein